MTTRSSSRALPARPAHHWQIVIERALKSLAVIFIAFTMLSFPPRSAEAELTAELIIVNGSVHTMQETHPTAEAVAILENRIVAVGSSTEVRALAGPKTRVIDAQQHTILPGFNDAHVHFLE